jgi:hypothetical protein
MRVCLWRGVVWARFGKKTEDPPVVTKRLERRDGVPLYLTEPHLQAALVTGSIDKLVVLPEFLDLNEWLASNSNARSRTQLGGPVLTWAGTTAYDFFHNINMVYGTLATFCSPRDCPTMSAADGCVCPRLAPFVRPTSLCACLRRGQRRVPVDQRRPKVGAHPGATAH